MVADDLGVGRRLAALLVLGQDALQVRRVDRHAAAARPLGEQLDEGHVVDAGVRVLHHGGHRDDLADVALEVLDDRQAADVDRVATLHHFLDRRLVGRDDLGRDLAAVEPRILQAQLEFGLLRRHIERQRAPLARAEDVGDDGELRGIAELVDRLLEDRHRVFAGVVEMLEDRGDLVLGHADRPTHAHHLIRKLRANPVDEPG